MLNIVFFSALVLYFVCSVFQFIAAALKKEKFGSIAWIVFLIAFALHTGYLIARGIIAGRLPMSNQFEFATSFAWGISLLLIILRKKYDAEWITVVAMPAAALILSYAALQPMEIKELMPALRSVWFGFHIGSAAIAYAAFIIAGGASLRYLLLARKEDPENAVKLHQMDYLTYRLIALGFLFLTITILVGAIWAEQAWSSFWTWDPKEVWALITWIVYAIYLHLHLRRKNQKMLAWFAIIAVPVVLFTFVGVNNLMPGMHSYG